MRKSGRPDLRGREGRKRKRRRLLLARHLGQTPPIPEEHPMMDPIRRNMLATGAAATAVAAAPQGFAQGLSQESPAQGGAKMSFYERGPVRIRYTEAGAGVPLLVIPGGGLNSTIANLTAANSPFDPIAEFKNEYRVIVADLRNAVP